MHPFLRMSLILWGLGIFLILYALYGCAGLSMKDTCRYCTLSAGARYAEAGYPVEVMRCNRLGVDHAIARAWKDGEWAYLYCAGNGDPLESKNPDCSYKDAYYLRFDEYVLRMMRFYHWDRTINLTKGEGK